MSLTSEPQVLGSLGMAAESGPTAVEVGQNPADLSDHEKDQLEALQREAHNQATQMEQAALAVFEQLNNLPPGADTGALSQQYAQLSAGAAQLRGVARGGNISSLMGALAMYGGMSGLAMMSEARAERKGVRLDQAYSVSSHAGALASAEAAAAAGISVANYELAHNYLRHQIPGFEDLEPAAQEQVAGHVGRMIEKDPDMKQGIEMLENEEVQEVIAEGNAQDKEAVNRVYHIFNENGDSQEYTELVGRMRKALGEEGKDWNYDPRITQAIEKHERGEISYEEMKSQMATTVQELEYASAGAAMKSFQALDQAEQQAIANMLGKDISEVTGEDLRQVSDETKTLRNEEFKREFEAASERLKEAGGDMSQLSEEEQETLATYQLKIGKQSAMAVYNLDQHMKTLSPEKAAELKQALGEEYEKGTASAERFSEILVDYGMKADMAVSVSQGLSHIDKASFMSELEAAHAAKFEYDKEGNITGVIGSDLSKEQLDAMTSYRTLNAAKVARATSGKLADMSKDPALSAGAAAQIAALSEQENARAKDLGLNQVSSDAYPEAAARAWDKLSPEQQQRLGGDKEAYIEEFVKNKFEIQTLAKVTPEQIQNSKEDYATQAAVIGDLEGQIAELEEADQPVPDELRAKLQKEQRDLRYLDSRVANLEFAQAFDQEHVTVLKEGASKEADRSVAMMSVIDREIAKAQAEGRQISEAEMKQIIERAEQEARSVEVSGQSTDEPERAVGPDRTEDQQRIQSEIETERHEVKQAEINPEAAPTVAQEKPAERTVSENDFAKITVGESFNIGWGGVDVANDSSLTPSNGVDTAALQAALDQSAGRG